jgi:CheY-like chemotaxis protein
MNTVVSLHRKPLVLVVEDDPATADVVGSILARSGCDVLVRATGASALDAARELPPPDLILLDLCLPDVDGRALLEELRRDVALAGIPVVVVSGAPFARSVYATDTIAKSDLEAGLARVLARLPTADSTAAA